MKDIRITQGVIAKHCNRVGNGMTKVPVQRCSITTSKSIHSATECRRSWLAYIILNVTSVCNRTSCLKLRGIAGQVCIRYIWYRAHCLHVVDIYNSLACRIYLKTQGPARQNFARTYPHHSKRSSEEHSRSSKHSLKVFYLGEKNAAKASNRGVPASDNSDGMRPQMRWRPITETSNIA